MGVRRLSRLLAVSAVSMVIASACAFGPQYSDRMTETRPVLLTVVDERGEPLHQAQITVGDRTVTTDEDGEVLIKISQPVSAVVSTDGALDEPAVIAPGDTAQTIRLWDRFGDNGVERTSMHFGGDVMLGRRYLQTDRTDTPLVTDAESARAIVEDLATMSAAADWTVVNLETVIGELPAEDAYTAKRFLLQSTPYTTEMLDELGVDLVTLGNNHAYDWGERGIASTLQALDAAGIAHVGAGTSREDAVRGRLVEVGNRSVGVVSFTTVNGSFVNDQLPGVDEPLPASLPADELWQYSSREFSFGKPGDQLYIRADRRRISEAWSLFAQLERDVGSEAVGELWSQLVAVYPELQDWVARRGHGGAAPYRREDMEDQIKQLKRDGAEVIVVQVHGGFQFAEVESEFLQGIAHAAIDAGADAVIAHHPHVLQGVEWYRDKLVVYSLGNLVFDQDFLETFPTAMLRLVTEGSNIIEARMMPVMLDRYRPIPVSGNTAAQIVRTIDERSALPAVAARVDDLEVGTELRPVTQGPVDLVSPASLRFQRNSGLIVKDRLERAQVVPIDHYGVGALNSCTVVRSDLLSSDAELGVDLYGWGRFDDDTADGRRDVPMHWTVPDDPDRWTRTAGRTLDPLDDAIELLTDTEQVTTMRLLARVDLAEHRLFDRQGAAVDTAPRLEIMMDVKRSRGERPSLRFVTFDFEDSNPTAAPMTTRLRELRLPIDVADDGDWHSISIPLPDDLFVPDEDGHRANTATLLIDTPPALRGRLAVDNLRIIEWRGSPDTEEPTWIGADLLNAPGARNVELTVSGC
jgi:poly-gamma-glutamate capsule biosynthesis protein CapA/YwtB (metallophosphatase superfamily)